MNNWRDIKKIPPPNGILELRVKYVYQSYASTTVSQTPYGAITITPPKMVSNEVYVGVDVIHVDPMNIDDPLSGGFRFSDLKGDFQNITHWMYTFDPYDESEEDLGVRKNKE